MYWVPHQQSGSVVHTWDMQPQNAGPVPLQRGFKSLADPVLRLWVSHLPPDTIITCGMWLGPCHVRTGFALDSVALENELSDFTQFCKSKHVMFFPMKGGG